MIPLIFSLPKSEPNKIKLAILMACHNRAAVTERALASIVRANAELGWSIKLFVVDDGSSDHTRTVIENSMIDAEIINGPGDWYWAKSMAIAESHVPESFEAKLWLNDDVELLPDALHNLAKYSKQFPDALIVGQLLNPLTNTISFGAKKRVDRFKNNFATVASSGLDDQFDTFCGNFLFVPSSASKAIGPIDGNFSHGFADLDYGLRASKTSIKIIAPPIFFGTCLPTPTPLSRNLRQRLSYLLTDKKGTPLKSQIRFFKRHGGKEWPFYVIFPFIGAIVFPSITAILGRNSNGRTRVVSNIKDLFKL